MEVMPPRLSRKYRTRRGIAEWLVERLAGDDPTLVGIDHGFYLPLRYFEVHELASDWPPRSSMASSAIGQRMMSRPLSISSVTSSSGTAQCADEMPAGDA
jgi:hypothetical protein